MTHRVLLVINSLDHGGSEHYVVRLVQMMAGLGLRFWVAYGEGAGSPLAQALPTEVGQIRLPHLTVRDVRAWRHVGTLRRAIRDNQIELVHTFLTSSALLGWLAGRLCRVPVVFSPGGPLRTRHGLERLGARLGLSRLVLPRMIDVWVAMSEFIREELVRTVGIPAARTTLIPHGVDVDRFRPMSPSSELQDALGMRTEDRVLCTIGSLRPVKGIPKAIHLVAELQRRRPGTRLIVVGDGPLRADYEALARQLGVGEQVRFLGTRRDIPDILSISDVYLVTTDSPLLGTATLEALACGKAIVAFARNDVERRMASEAVIEDRTGIIVPTDYAEAASRVAALLDEPVRLAAMGQASRRLAEDRFDFRRTVRLHAELYARLIETGRIA